MRGALTGGPCSRTRNHMSKKRERHIENSTAETIRKTILVEHSVPEEVRLLTRQQEILIEILSDRAGHTDE